MSTITQLRPPPRFAITFPDWAFHAHVKSWKNRLIQTMQVKIKGHAGTALADWDGLQNSYAEGDSNPTVSETDVRGRVGENDAITVPASANDNNKPEERACGRPGP